MRPRTLPIVLLLIVIAIVGISNHSRKKSKLPLIDPISVSSSATMEEKLRSIDRWLLALSKKKRFNGAILISKDNKPDLMKAYGYQDFKREKLLTHQSSFRLGSVSKQFTAMALMILNNEGKLKYDDSVQKYLPSFPYRDVSIRHLLTHTSGIADYMNLALKEYFSLFTKIGFYMNQSMVNLFYDGEPSEYKDHYTILTSNDVLNMIGKYRERRLFSCFSNDRIRH